MNGTVISFEGEFTKYLFLISKIKQVFSVKISLQKEEALDKLKIVLLSGDSGNMIRAKNFLTAYVCPQEALCQIFDFDSVHDFIITRNIEIIEGFTGVYIQAAESSLFIYGVNKEIVSLAVSFFENIIYSVNNPNVLDDSLHESPPKASDKPKKKKKKKSLQSCQSEVVNLNETPVSSVDSSCYIMLPDSFDVNMSASEFKSSDDTANITEELMEVDIPENPPSNSAPGGGDDDAAVEIINILSSDNENVPKSDDKKKKKKKKKKKSKVKEDSENDVIMVEESPFKVASEAPDQSSNPTIIITTTPATITTTANQHTTPPGTCNNTQSTNSSICHHPAPTTTSTDNCAPSKNSNHNLPNDKTQPNNQPIFSKAHNTRATRQNTTLPDHHTTTHNNNSYQKRPTSSRFQPSHPATQHSHISNNYLIPSATLPNQLPAYNTTTSNNTNNNTVSTNTAIVPFPISSNVQSYVMQPQQYFLNNNNYYYTATNNNFSNFYNRAPYNFLKPLRPPNPPCDALNELTSHTNNNNNNSITNKHNNKHNNTTNSNSHVSRQSSRDSLRMIVVDGSNVAMQHGLNKTFSCKGIKLVVDYFVERGHKVMVFVPQWRRSPSNHRTPFRDLSVLEELFSKGFLAFTPSRKVGNSIISSYDDRYILRLATDENGVVISSDQYQDLYQEECFKETIRTRILQVTFIGDKVMFPDDPLGRTGPTLDQFLTKEWRSHVQKYRSRARETRSRSRNFRR